MRPWKDRLGIVASEVASEGSSSTEDRSILKNSTERHFKRRNANLADEAQSRNGSRCHQGRNEAVNPKPLAWNGTAEITPNWRSGSEP